MCSVSAPLLKAEGSSCLLVTLHSSSPSRPLQNLYRKSIFVDSSLPYKRDEMRLFSCDVVVQSGCLLLHMCTEKVHSVHPTACCDWWRARTLLEKKSTPVYFYLRKKYTSVLLLKKKSTQCTSQNFVDGRFLLALIIRGVKCVYFAVT